VRVLGQQEVRFPGNRPGWFRRFDAGLLVEETAQLWRHDPYLVATAWLMVRPACRGAVWYEWGLRDPRYESSIQNASI
jgi:hypothetical protein